MDEQSAMRRAVALSRAVLGTTSPNPPVGAVVLDAAGEVVGEGATQPPGGPHAEVVALAAAGERARGGTAVVTLEPCAHTGRTGPCTEALLAAGIARVVVGRADPTALAGGGADRLREQGVDVDVLEHEAPVRSRPGSPRRHRPAVRHLEVRRHPRRPQRRRRRHEPLDHAEAARADVHRLRGEVDAVLAGAGTVLQDDPLLDVATSTPAGHQPLRVVVDTRARTPLTARCLAGRRRHWSSPDRASTTRLPAHRAAPLGEDGRVDLAALLALLQDEHDVVSVLLEGGPVLAGSFVAAGLVDRVVGYVAPALLGDGPNRPGAGRRGNDHRRAPVPVRRRDARRRRRAAHDEEEA